MPSKSMFLFGFLMLFFLACLSEPDLNCSSDTDRDGLFDCDERLFGTDYTEKDSDGDGSSDKEEYDCGSDPLDSTAFCYACGWEHRDPGNIVATGNDVGDTIENVRFVDQCLERVPLYDFAGQYNILHMTAQWCASCKEEVREFSDRSYEYSAQYGVNVGYLIAIFHDNQSTTPEADVAERYALETQIQNIPILADVDGQLLNQVPYEGIPVPAKCLLSPRMEMLSCTVGDDEEELLSILE